MSEDTFNDLKAYEVKPGEVLFSMMGTIGKCQIMPKGYPKDILRELWIHICLKQG